MQIEHLGRDRVLLEATIERLIALLDALDAPFTDLEDSDEDEAVDDRPIDEPHQDMEPDTDDLDDSEDADGLAASAGRLQLLGYQVARRVA